MFDLVYKYGGSFSAEHGIGKMKIKELEKYSSFEELSLKKQIKNLFDPHGIMNPGKGFQLMSNYNIPLDEMYFTLTQVENMKNNSENDYSSEFNASNMRLLLEEAGKFAREKLDNINAKGDIDGIKLENGVVRMPEYFVSAYKAFVESGWFSVVGEKNYGGQEFPWKVLVLINEI